MTEAIVRQQQLLPQVSAAWLSGVREKAFAQFLKQGFPDTRNEEWKYTKLDALSQKSFEIATSTPLTEQQIADLCVAEHVVVVVNGAYSETLSKLENLPAQVIVESLASAIKQQRPEVALHLKTIPEEAFLALNTAFLQDGVFVYVPSHMVLESPLQLLFINTQEAWAQPRNIVVVDQGASATVVETFHSTAAAITNVLTDVLVRNQGDVTYIKHQAEYQEAFHIGMTRLYVGAHSQANAYTLSTGSRLARSDVTLYLQAEQAVGHLYGVYLAQGKQHLDQHTVTHHVAAFGTSHEFYRGIINDKARAVFNGKVFVQPQAAQTKASQLNHNLLLSSEAEIDAKPELEIYHDDVQCSHGATIGQLDEQALFYLRSRGISEKEAKRLLIQAFAREVFATLKQADIQEKLLASIDSLLS